ncbi:ABC transporter ATP-binding protein [Methylobacterium sp. HMF5984]|uniref:ABC transporter ATP-binding protein n=1 Tax=Methylobacterium sp. HMF5984 TaxID=3367370 RepID=UPI003851C609
MIIFDHVTKIYKTRQGVIKTVLENSSFSFEPGNNYGILAANGSGKSTLLRLIAGAELPNRGRIIRRARVSFPLGFSGTFHGHATGRQNAMFLARVYGQNVRDILEFVSEFSELGDYFDMAVQTYSSGMQAKLAFAICLAIDFDIYLVDEVTEVGDERFRRKCSEAFEKRMGHSDIILVSHNESTIRSYCNRGAVLVNGGLVLFDSINDALRAYRKISSAHHE